MECKTFFKDWDGYLPQDIEHLLKQDLDGQRRQSRIEKTIKALGILKG